MALSKARIIMIFIGNGALMKDFLAAVADVGGFGKPYAMFQLEGTASGVTAAAGAAGHLTGMKALTNVNFTAAITMDTEVLRIIEASSVPGIESTMSPNFF